MVPIGGEKSMGKIVCISSACNRIDWQLWSIHNPATKCQYPVVDDRIFHENSQKIEVLYLKIGPWRRVRNTNPKYRELQAIAEYLYIEITTKVTGTSTSRSAESAHIYCRELYGKNRKKSGVSPPCACGAWAWSFWKFGKKSRNLPSYRPWRARNDGRSYSRSCW